MNFTRYRLMDVSTGDIARITLNLSDIVPLLKVLKLGINCSPVQNTEGGRRVIDLIKQMEEIE